MKEFLKPTARSMKIFIPLVLFWGIATMMALSMLNTEINSFGQLFFIYTLALPFVPGGFLASFSNEFLERFLHETAAQLIGISLVLASGLFVLFLFSKYLSIRTLPKND